MKSQYISSLAVVKCYIGSIAGRRRLKEVNVVACQIFSRSFSNKYGEDIGESVCEIIGFKCNTSCRRGAAEVRIDHSTLHNASQGGEGRNKPGSVLKMKIVCS